MNGRPGVHNQSVTCQCVFARFRKKYIDDTSPTDTYRILGMNGEVKVRCLQGQDIMYSACKATLLISVQ